MPDGRGAAILAGLMSRQSPLSPSPLAARWLVWPYRLLMLLAACTGFAAIWVALAWSSDGQCSWMAVVGALDVAWIVRLVGWPAGRRRALAAALATVALAIAANWWIIAVQLGAGFGLDPLDSALRLGIHHAWVLARLANGAIDVALIAAAPVVASLLSR